MTPSTLSDRALAARATMIRLLDSNADCAIGFPVASLMRGCWRPSCSGVSASGSQVAVSALRVWIRQLDSDLALLRPGAGPSIERIRQQTGEARALLVELLACAAALLEPPPPPAPEASAMRGSARSACLASAHAH